MVPRPAVPSRSERRTMALVNTDAARPDPYRLVSMHERAACARVALTFVSDPGVGNNEDCQLVAATRRAGTSGCLVLVREHPFQGTGIHALRRIQAPRCPGASTH